MSTRGWLLVAALWALWLLMFPISLATGAWWLVSVVGSVALGAGVFACLVVWAAPPVEAEVKRAESLRDRLWVLVPVWLGVLWLAYDNDFAARWTIGAVAIGAAWTAKVAFDIAQEHRAGRPDATSDAAAERARPCGQALARNLFMRWQRRAAIATVVVVSSAKTPSATVPISTTTVGDTQPGSASPGNGSKENHQTSPHSAIRARPESAAISVTRLRCLFDESARKAASQVRGTSTGASAEPATRTQRAPHSTADMRGFYVRSSARQRGRDTAEHPWSIEGMHCSRVAGR